MALQYLTTWANPTYRKLFGYSRPAITFRAGILNCAPYFMLTQKLWPATQAYFPKKVLTEKKTMMATEESFTDALPPLYIATANQDFLRDDSMKFAGFLMAHHHPHVAKVYGDDQHPRQHDFMISQKDKLAEQVLDDEIQFIQKNLK